MRTVLETFRSLFSGDLCFDDTVFKNCDVPWFQVLFLYVDSDHDFRLALPQKGLYLRTRRHANYFLT